MSKPSSTLPYQAMTGMAGSLIPRQSLASLGQRTMLDGITSANLQVPFAVSAVEADTYERRLHYWELKGMPSDTRVLPYVEASSGLVPVEPAGKIEGHYWVDGGIRDNYGIQYAVDRLVAEGAKDAALMVVDASPSEGMSASVDVFHGTNVALSTLFRDTLINGLAAAKDHGFRTDYLDAAGDHTIFDFMNPQDGVGRGAQVVQAWARGEQIGPHWPSSSFLRRVANVVSFQVHSMLHSIPDKVRDITTPQSGVA